jgi:hypothetical protein
VPWGCEVVQNSVQGPHDGGVQHWHANSTKNPIFCTGHSDRNSQVGGQYDTTLFLCLQNLLLQLSSAPFGCMETWMVTFSCPMQAAAGWLDDSAATAQPQHPIRTAVRWRWPVDKQARSPLPKLSSGAKMCSDQGPNVAHALCMQGVCIMTQSVLACFRSSHMHQIHWTSATERISDYCCCTQEY